MQASARRNSRSLVYLRLLIVIIVCFTISCMITQVCIKNASHRINELNSEYFSLSQQVADLDNELKYVRSDAYCERVARDEFGLIYPGEIRYVTN